MKRILVAAVALLFSIGTSAQAIVDLPALGAAPATNDLLIVRDTSASSTKSATVANLLSLITGGTCTNQYVTAVASSTGVPTCTTDTLASAYHANQGTTTTVLHGNAAGNPSWGAVSLTADVSGTLPVANGGTGITSLGTGVATALGSAVTGSGGPVLATSPTITTPTISGVLTVGTTSSTSSAAVQFSGDPNTGLHYVSADKFALLAGGTQAIIVDGAGALMTMTLDANWNSAAQYGYTRKVNALTADTTINNVQYSRKVITNTGAAGAIALTESATTVGTEVTFAVTVAQYLKVQVTGSDVIYDGTTTSAAAGYIRSNAVGSTLTLTLVATNKWMVISKTGTWTVDS